MGYVSNTIRTRTRNLFRPKCVQILLGHTDGCDDPLVALLCYGFLSNIKESSNVVESLILEDVDEGESRSENVMSCIARTETIHSAVNPVKLPSV